MFKVTVHYCVLCINDVCLESMYTTVYCLLAMYVC